MSPLARGLRAGLASSLRLLRVMLPFSIGFDLLSRTPVLGALGRLAAPLMSPFGLPGEAAAAILTGLFMNLYGAIAVVPALKLTVAQVTTLGLMLGFAHTLPVEIAVLRAVGTRWLALLSYRLGMFVVSGLVMSRLLGTTGTGTPAVAGIALAAAAPPQAATSILVEVIGSALWLSFKITLIVVSILTLFEILGEMKAVRRVVGALGPVLRRLGISRGGAVALFAGLGLGLAYGAGVIMRAKETHDIAPGELFRVALFLCTCHAIVEDTLLFVAVGANGWWIVAIRATIAMSLLVMLAPGQPADLAKSSKAEAR